MAIEAYDLANWIESSLDGEFNDGSGTIARAKVRYCDDDVAQIRVTLIDSDTDEEKSYYVNIERD